MFAALNTIFAGSVAAVACYIACTAVGPVVAAAAAVGIVAWLQTQVFAPRTCC